MEKSLIIIGAGTAGLSAGCYSQMNGYHTTIIEMAKTPGGLCTSWKRKGYLFDGSVAGLAGSAPGNPLYRLWQELGVIDYCPLHFSESFGSIQLLDGRVITVFSNIDRLKVHLLDNFPSEAEIILEFISALYSVLDMDVPFTYTSGFRAVMDGLKNFINTFTHIPVVMKYSNLTIDRFNSRIEDTGLRTVFNNLVHFGGGDVPLLTVLLPLAFAHRRMAGIPQKGWLSFARAIERRYLELGGNAIYQKKVQQVIMENGVVKGVKFVDGSQMLADRVLTTADGRFSESLLLGKPEGQTERVYDPKMLSDQPVQVNLGVGLRGIAETGSITYILPRAAEVAGHLQNRIIVHDKYYDPDAAPKGKSAITVFLNSDYDWWHQLASDKPKYRKEKQACAEFVIDSIAQFNPGFREAIEVIDVSTPITRERYTGNWMGAMQARKPDSNMIKALMQANPRYDFKGIKNLYRAGQWVESWGGITTAAQSGRKAVQLMCRNDGKSFSTDII